MRIGLDFDRVLFDTDRFDDFYKDNVEGLHHVEDPAPMKNGVYDPEMHADLCNIPIQRIWSVFTHDLSSFIYSDVDEILKKLNKNHELLIVTRGHERFQNSKVRASGISKYIEKVVVVQEESKDVEDIELLVDDRSYEIERVSIPAVRIDRPEDGLEKVLEKVDGFEA